MSKSAEAFRTISEVADWLGVQTHVLRFWESKFTQIKPIKRAGGRRYYRPADMLLIGGIRKLLHGDGLTIKGVQKLLREEGIAHVLDMSAPLEGTTVSQAAEEIVKEASFIVAEPEHNHSVSSVSPFPLTNKPNTIPEPQIPKADWELDQKQRTKQSYHNKIFEENPKAPVTPQDLPQSQEKTTPAKILTEALSSSEDISKLNAVEPSPKTENEFENSARISFPSMRASRLQDNPKSDETLNATNAPPNNSKLKPRVIKTPDEITRESMNISTSLFVKLVQIKNLGTEQQKIAKPLIDRLLVLRNKMTKDQLDLK